MARVDATPQRNMGGGEQSPDVLARADLSVWHTAMAKIENFIVLATGGATRRSGLRDINQALANSTLIPFAFSSDDGYAIEVAPGKCRFYRDYAYLANEDNSIYELVTPFTLGEIPNIRATQSADVMFVTTGARVVQRLARVDANDWTIGDAALRNGPFMDPNADQTIFLYTEEDDDLPTGSSFVIKAFGADVFKAGHVGAQFLIRELDGGKHGLWKPESVTLNIGSIIRWNNNVYICTDRSSGDHETGNEPPVHLFGEQWDGDDHANALKWKYLHSGYGVVTITNFTDARTVTVTAQSYIPDELQGSVAGDVLTGGTWRWSEGAFSAVRGYPRIAKIHRSRLYLFSTTAQPTTLWASALDDYTNFIAFSGLATDGFAETLEADTGRVNIPQWAESGKRMGIGTSGDEHVLDSATPGEPIKPDTVDVVPATSEGSASIAAVRIDGPVFISKDGRRIHELGYEFASDSFVAPDLTLLANHMAGDNGGRFTGLAWQRDPYRLLYATRADGDIAACTYRKDQSITAWHRHPTVKGNVEKICTVPSPTGIRQDLWAITTRTCAGGTSRRIESLMPFFEQGDHDVTKAFFADGAVMYDGAPATEISNIPAHLNGEPVAVLADGTVVRDLVVAGGKIELPYAASRVIVGLPLSAELETLRFDRQFYGALNDDRMNVKKIVVDALRSAGVKAAMSNSDDDGNDYELLTPSEGGVMNAPASLRSGALTIDAVPGDWDDGGQISILCDTPLPATIRAINPIMLVST